MPDTAYIFGDTEIDKVLSASASLAAVCGVHLHLNSHYHISTRRTSDQLVLTLSHLSLLLSHLIATNMATGDAGSPNPGEATTSRDLR
jgi:hypothetical protein